MKPVLTIISCFKTYLHGVFISLQLFDKVVSVLDPDMSVNSSSALPTPTGDHAGEADGENCAEPSKEEVNRAKRRTSTDNMQVALIKSKLLRSKDWKINNRMSVIIYYFSIIFKQP